MTLLKKETRTDRLRNWKTARATTKACWSPRSFPPHRLCSIYH